MLPCNIADLRQISRVTMRPCSNGSVAGCIRLAVPEASEWHRIGNQIDATMIFARADFVNVLRASHRTGERLAGAID